jgi:hypothetical protein
MSSEKTPAGFWAAREVPGGQIAAHAKIPGGPLTIYWPGETQGGRLQDFISKAAPELAAKHLGVHHSFTTTLLTDDDEIRVLSLKGPMFPNDVGAHAGFVRFEWGPAEDDGHGGGEHEPALVAWARLDRLSPAPDDSIGVYGSPKTLRLLRHEIASLVHDTSAGKGLPSDDIMKLLATLQDELSK